MQSDSAGRVKGFTLLIMFFLRVPRLACSGMYREVFSIHWAAGNQGCTFCTVYDDGITTEQNALHLADLLRLGDRKSFIRRWEFVRQSLVRIR